MRLLIYRQNGEIYRISDAKHYEEKYGNDALMEALKRFNDAKKNGNTCELREVPAGFEDMAELLMTEDCLLIADEIVHPCNEAVPQGSYIYAFYKYEGHDTLCPELMKFNSGGECQLPCLHDKKGRLPIAWCYARDLRGLLGISKSDINRLWKIAKSMAWAWYDKEE